MVWNKARGGRAIGIAVGMAALVLLMAGGAGAGTIYVPDNYAKMQWAVDNASAGDTIIVRDGTYIENINVNKRLTITSENGSDKTTVQAANSNDHVFEVTADYVNISGFKVKGATNAAGIYLTYHADRGSISDNNVSGNLYGIYIYSRSHGGVYGRTNVFNSTFSNNTYGIYSLSDFTYRYGEVYVFNSTFTNNTYGIYSSNYCGVWASNSTFSNNTYGIYGKQKLGISAQYSIFLNNTYGIFGDGIWVLGSEFSTFFNNIYANYGYGMTDFVSRNSVFLNNTYGMYSYRMYDDGDPTGVVVHSTVFSNNTRALYINNYYGVEAEIKNSTFSKNIYAIDIPATYSTFIYLNNFVSNINNVYNLDSINVIWSSAQKINYTYNGSTFTNYTGNYWSDYNGSDANSDGIGDTPYNISSDKDNYPLMKLWENYFAVLSEQPQLKAPWRGTARITQGNHGTTSHYDHGTWDNTYAIDVVQWVDGRTEGIFDVLAPADGVVYDNLTGPAGGNELVIEHTGPTGKKFITVYLHLNQTLVNKNDSVKQGQVVAKSGATGNVTGPHLHFHIWRPKGSEPEWSYDSHTMPIEGLVMKQVGVDSDFREYDARKGELDDDKIAEKYFESNNAPLTKPTAITGGPYKGNINESIQFYGSAMGGTPPYTYAWDFDKDGITDSTLQNPTHSWSSAGTYYPTLKVQDENGMWSEPKECRVYVFEPFTFVQITDVHIDNDWKEYPSPFIPLFNYRESEAKFRSTLYEIKEINPKFILITGDLVEYDDETLFNVYLRNLRQYIISNGIRVYHVPGNHDRRRLLEEWHIVYITGLKNYTDIVKPLNGPPAPEPLKDGYEDYYFDEGGYKFIGLDSGYDYSIGDTWPPLSPEGSGLEESQYNRLFESDLKDHPRKIIFMHHPMINVGDDSGVDPVPNLCPEYGGNDMCIGVYRCPFIEYYCIPNNVQLVLTGHTHKSYQVYIPNSDKPHSGTYFFQTPSATKDEGEFKHGYRIIDIKDGKVHPHSYTPTKTQPMIWGAVASPVTLHAYDSQGRHTGINASSGEVERNIPDSFYFGRYNLSDHNESEMILLYNTSESYQFEIVSNLTTKPQMQAELMTLPLSGSFNFTLEKQTNASLTTISFINVSILENTTASVHVNPINPVEAHKALKASSDYTMEIDLDGDGTIDQTKDPDSIETDYAPNATIISPVNNSIYLYGDGITFNGTGTDLEDGILTNSSLVWSSSIDGYIGIGNKFNTTNLSAGTHVIELMVNDTSGQIDIDNVTITVIAPDLAIDTSNISFSNPYPVEGENITINATIHNIGTANATNVTVQFFDGEPMNGAQIGANQTIASVE